MAISKDEHARQPDIGYAPNYEKYQARAERRLATEDLPTALPDGFPQSFKSDLVWDKDDVASRFNWTYELTPSDLQELKLALHHFKGLNQSLGHINQTTFPLPTLHAKLRQVSREIHHGFGFKVVRGLPVDQHTREEILILYAGLAAHVASTRGRQDSQYNGKSADVMLNHIKDLTDAKDAMNKIGSPAYTADKQVFHTDSGDVIALLCLSEAQSGGQSKVSSSWRVYNELARARPDLIRTLAEEWPTEIFGDPNTNYTSRPLLFYTPPSSTSPERLIIQYARRTFTGFQSLPRSSSIPPISEAQAEALDALHFTAEKYALSLDFQKGDVQFVNNLSIFHARDGFTDSAEKKRHLVRLWLRDEENAWELPRDLRARWDTVYGGVREEAQVFPLEAYVRSASLGATKKE